MPVCVCQSRVRLWTLACLLFWCADCAFAAIDVNTLPKPTGYVSDLAHVVSSEDKERLELLCTQVEQQLGVQFALVTIDTIGDTPIENLTLALARKWGVGDRKSNQGALLLLAVQDHKDRVEVGRGLEPYITDGFAGGTLRAMRPQLRTGGYGAALQAGATEMANQIARGKNIAFTPTGVPPPRQPLEDQGSGRSGIPIPLIIFGVIFLILLIARAGRGGRGGGGGGFLTGILLGSLFNSGRGGGGGWGGGGFGGNSGGGGGFGGFGGGDFGGGGASSDW